MHLFSLRHIGSGGGCGLHQCCLGPRFRKSLPGSPERECWGFESREKQCAVLSDTYGIIQGFKSRGTKAHCSSRVVNFLYIITFCRGRALLQQFLPWRRSSRLLILPMSVQRKPLKVSVLLCHMETQWASLSMLHFSLSVILTLLLSLYSPSLCLSFPLPCLRCAILHHLPQFVLLVALFLFYLTSGTGHP